MRKTIAALSATTLALILSPTAAEATILAEPKVSWSDRSCHNGTLKVTTNGTAPTDVTIFVEGSRDVIVNERVGSFRTVEFKVGCVKDVIVSSKSAGVPLGDKVKTRKRR